ncbi:MAG: type II toxin-antitoxin system RelE/ParE family toxin [Ignavibacteriota bacterium]
MKVIWTKESIINLNQIEDFISEDNPIAAVNLIDKLIALTEKLKMSPNKGRIVPELSLSQIREIIYKNYRVVYLLKKDSIEILTVFESHKLLNLEDFQN